MSQTTGQGGADPDKDAWLKQFKGIPDSAPAPAETDPDDLTWDRPEQDIVLPKRSGNYTPVADEITANQTSEDFTPGPVTNTARRVLQVAVIVVLAGLLITLARMAL